MVEGEGEWEGAEEQQPCYRKDDQLVAVGEFRVEKVGEREGEWQGKLKYHCVGMSAANLSISSCILRPQAFFLSSLVSLSQ